MYKSIEDVPERDIERAMDYMGAVVRLAVSPTSSRIVQGIVDECLLHGECHLTHWEFVRRTETCRRTVDRAIAQLLKAGLVSRTAKTDSPGWIYKVEWQRGAEYRAWGKEFDKKWAEARAARRLKHFEAPAYPGKGEAKNGRI